MSVRIGDEAPDFTAQTTEGTIVFHDWIAQNEVLSKALLNQKIEADFIDTKGHLEHQFGEEFKRFISPYLSPILIAAAGSKDQAFETKFSFTKLLDEDHRATIEFELFKPLKVKIKALQEIVYDQEEEQELALKLYEEDDLDAARQLVIHHLRFVVHIARSYQGYGLPLADIIQEGNVGLMKAVDKYDPHRGVKVVSFAVHWIKAEIHKYILKNWRLVKIATTKAQRKLFFNLRGKKKSL